MKRIKGGTKVEAGFYWRAAEWEIVTLSGDGGTLPGDASEVLYRIPTIGMLAAAPVMGALFVMFLPFIGFALVLKHLANLAVEGSKSAALAVGATLVPSWRPGEAYFANRKGHEPKGEAKPEDAKKSETALDGIEKEIEERRKS